MTFEYKVPRINGNRSNLILKERNQQRSWCQRYAVNERRTNIWVKKIIEIIVSPFESHCSFINESNLLLVSKPIPGMNKHKPKNMELFCYIFLFFFTQNIQCHLPIFVTKQDRFGLVSAVSLFSQSIFKRNVNRNVCNKERNVRAKVVKCKLILCLTHFKY